MDGIELCIRFSSVTNQLQFCGPLPAQEQFRRYLEKKDNPAEVKEAFRKFEGLYPYLSAIAAKHNKHFLDYDVVEAYWIGNALLDAFTKEDMAGIISSLVQRGLPKTLADQLIQKLPDGFVPHHLFNVVFVGVGNTTGSVPATLQNMENCRPSWGTVKDFMGRNLLVEMRPLRFMDGQYILGKEETRTIVHDPSWFPDLKKGASVALHWGMACCVLTEEQETQLAAYTQRILDVMNRLQPI